MGAIEIRTAGPGGPAEPVSPSLPGRPWGEEERESQRRMGWGGGGGGLTDISTKAKGDALNWADI